MKSSAMKCALCGMMLCLGAGAYAQDITYNNPDNRAYWGARLDVDVNIPGKYKTTSLGNFDFSSGFGFGLGAFYQVPLFANLYLEPGASIYFDTFKTDEITVHNADGSITETFTPRVEQFGFRVPVLLGYRFDLLSGIGISIFTGPEVNIGLTARLKGEALKNADIETDLYSGNNVLGANGSWHRFNLGWQVGGSLTVDRVTIGLHYCIGITDVVEDSKVSFKENALRIAMAYNF